MSNAYFPSLIFFFDDSLYNKQPQIAPIGQAVLFSAIWGRYCYGKNQY